MRHTTISLLIAILPFLSEAQTNVSGGIYANTTWTKVNSPYIVTDTVVVFPGVTLTIEPGVIVRFDDGMQLEIRQASLIANGTITDSITFTSNTSTTAEAWGEIFLNGVSSGSQFRYCNVYYSAKGIRDEGGSTSVKHSNFINNGSGISDIYAAGIGLIIDSCNFFNNIMGLGHGKGAQVTNCTFSSNTIGIQGSLNTRFDIQSCTISNNQKGCVLPNFSRVVNSIIDSNTVTGIWLGQTDTVINCEIKNNPIGIDILYGQNKITQNVIDNNSIGIRIKSTGSSIYCNRICNNTTYDIMDTIAFGSNISLANNYWCTFDTAALAARIYDGYDNIDLGLVYVSPLDNQSCYLINGVVDNTVHEKISIFPNPATDLLNISIGPGSISELRIYNLLGALKASSVPHTVSASLDVSSLSKGLYILEVVSGDYSVWQKFVKE